MDTGELLLIILGTGGVASIVVAAINGYLSKRKLGAEATQIITSAATGVVERIQIELDRTIKARDANEARLLELERQQIRDRVAHDAEMRGKEIAWANMQEDWRQSLQLHAAWDAMAVAELNAHEGTHLPVPPPLYPPAHARQMPKTGENDTLGS